MMEGWDSLDNNLASFSAISRCDLECIDVTFNTNGPWGISPDPAFAPGRPSEPSAATCSDLPPSTLSVSFTRYTYEKPPIVIRRVFSSGLLLVRSTGPESRDFIGRRRAHGQSHDLPSPRSFVTLKFKFPMEIFSPTRAVPRPPSAAGIVL